MCIETVSCLISSSCSKLAFFDVIRECSHLSSVNDQKRPLFGRYLFMKHEKTSLANHFLNMGQRDTYLFIFACLLCKILENSATKGRNVKKHE